MKLQDSVKKFMLQIIIGEILLTMIMVAVFAVLKKLDGSVWAGALLGMTASVANYFLMSLSVQNAAAKMNGVKPAAIDPGDEQSSDDEAAAPTPEETQVRKVMQRSYTLRMLMLVAVCVIGLAVPVFHPLAVVIPLLFPRIVVLVQGIIHKKEA